MTDALAEGGRTVQVRCVDCDAKFGARVVSPGAELNCPACGTAIVVGERTTGRRRRPRSIGLEIAVEPMRATRMRRVGVLILVAAVGLAAWAWWSEISAAVATAVDAVSSAWDPAPETVHGR